MGPPPFSDGNRGERDRDVYIHAAFNGATAFQRWKPSIADRPAPPVTPLQWGHRLSAMETSAIHPPGVLHVFHLQWGHRLSAMETRGGADRRPCEQHPFNGATAFQRWKRWESSPTMRAGSSLQWGHRLSAMETALADLPDIRPARPSMGPPPFSDGNPLREFLAGPVERPSMGPPPFSDGNAQGPVRRHRGDGVPSMGPPPFSDGNTVIQ